MLQEWLVMDLSTGVAVVLEGDFPDKPAADAYIAAQVTPGLKLIAIQVTLT